MLLMFMGQRDHSWSCAKQNKAKSINLFSVEEHHVDVD